MTVETLHQPVAPQSGPEAPELAVAFRHVGQVCILSLDGALTANTLRAFESQIDRLGRTPCHRVVVDLSGLQAVDDAGMRVLIGLHHYVRARGGRLSVTGATGSVFGVLASTPLLAG
jgi:anti-anti-sigma factor